MNPYKARTQEHEAWELGWKGHSATTSTMRSMSDDSFDKCYSEGDKAYRKWVSQNYPYRNKRPVIN